MGEGIPKYNLFRSVPSRPCRAKKNVPGRAKKLRAGRAGPCRGHTEKWPQVARTSLEGSVWPDLAKKRNTGSNGDHLDRFRASKQQFSVERDPQWYFLIQFTPSPAFGTSRFYVAMIQGDLKTEQRHLSPVALLCGVCAMKKMIHAGMPFGIDFGAHKRHDHRSKRRKSGRGTLRTRPKPDGRCS